jgi:hypothetical protein
VAFIHMELAREPVQHTARGESYEIHVYRVKETGRHQVLAWIYTGLVPAGMVRVAAAQAPKSKRASKFDPSLGATGTEYWQR